MNDSTSDNSDQSDTSNNPEGSGIDTKIPPADWQDTAATGDPWTFDEESSREERSPKANSSRQLTTAKPRAVPADAFGRPLAGWWRRVGAFAIDSAILFVVSIVLWIAFFVVGTSKIGTFIVLAVNFAYFTFTIGSASGQTPGMKATGIAVCDAKTGRNIGFGKAFARYLLIVVFYALAFIGLLVDCLWLLYDEKRQALHDKAVGTVVIAAGFESPTFVAPVAPAAHQASSSFRWSSTINAVLGSLRTKSSRFWITAAISVASAIVLTVGVVVTTSFVSSQHSPAKAAVAYVEALSDRNVPALLGNVGLVMPSASGTETAVLLTPSDIKKELAAQTNSLGSVSNVEVTGTHTAGNTATVSLEYLADNQSHHVVYNLVRSTKTSSGWAVQVTPARLDIDVPTGTTTLTVAGIRVPIDGQVAHVYLFPSTVTISIPATSIFAAASQTVDATQSSPNSDPQETGLQPQLLPTASTSAQAAVVNQINACLASTSLTPANCPNSDTPTSTNQGDSYSGITWNGIGQPTAGFTVSVSPSGEVSVAGSFTASVTYTDTTAGDSFFGPVSNQQTDGPRSWNFTYPITWNGSVWVLGQVSAQTTND